ncbi:large ribosomal subunit protein bL35 [Flindersiella endophytica]
MPKMKTHSGAKKRFRVTAKGKLIYKQRGTGHLNEHKAAKRKRRLGQPAQVSKADAPKINRLLAR